MKTDPAGRVTVVMLSVLSGLVVTIVFAWLHRVPLPAEVPGIVGDASILAYNSDEGAVPLVLLRRDGELALVTLTIDRRPLRRLHHPIWQVGSTISRIEPSTDPASMTIVGCAADAATPCDDPVVLVGEIGDARITRMEIQANGQTRPFLTSPPAFIKRLPRGVCLGDVRWLDVSGRQIWRVERSDAKDEQRCALVRKALSGN